MGAFFLLRMNDHVQYLNRIKATLDGRGDFRGSDHHFCRLGKWLDNEGPAEAAALGPEGQALLESILEPHRQFHEASSEAIHLQESGDQQGMEACITQMHQLSALLVDKLLELDRLSGKK